MATRTMSDSQIARFTKSMESQGVTVIRTKKGLFLRLPNGESTTVHFTNSDVRAHDNLIARLRRAGVVHPEDKRAVAQLPASITEANVAEGTRSKIRQAVEKMDWPDAVTVQDIMREAGLEHITASRGLYSMGFTPVRGKNGGRDWLVPDDVLALKPHPEVEAALAEIEVDDDTEKVGLSEAMNPTRDEAEVERLKQYRNPGKSIGEAASPEFLAEHATSESAGPSGEREFIDTHDSWTVDLKDLLGYTWPQIEDKLKILGVLGMEYEFRVWRKQ